MMTPDHPESQVMHPQVNTVRSAAAVLAVMLLTTQPGNAWNAEGHRVITRAAIGALPADVAPWVREARSTEMAAEQSVEPDRWRSTRLPPMAHENSPDHYLDLEELGPYGLNLDTLPRYRYDYVKVMAQAKALHPEAIPAYDEAKDKDRSREWPGFLPYAITEQYAKLVSSFSTLRILEAVGRRDPARVSAPQLERARANVLYHMGVLSHFVGDAAQPLHTTVHHHGWVGDNPHGYTTRFEFHAYVDGGLVALHRIDAATVSAAMRPVTVSGADPWSDAVAEIHRSFEQVEPLYVMDRDGSITRAEGKALLTSRMADAASVLSALYAAAWAQSEPTDASIAAFLRYER
jgi:hypothetical protein